MGESNSTPVSIGPFFPQARYWLSSELDAAFHHTPDEVVCVCNWDKRKKTSVRLNDMEEDVPAL